MLFCERCRFQQSFRTHKATCPGRLDRVGDLTTRDDPNFGRRLVTLSQPARSQRYLFTGASRQSDSRRCLRQPPFFGEDQLGAHILVNTCAPRFTHCWDLAAATRTTAAHRALLDRPRSMASRISRSLCKLLRIRPSEAGQPFSTSAASLTPIKAGAPGWCQRSSSGRPRMPSLSVATGRRRHSRRLKPHSPASGCANPPAVTCRLQSRKFTPVRASARWFLSVQEPPRTDFVHSREPA